LVELLDTTLMNLIVTFFEKNYYRTLRLDRRKQHHMSFPTTLFYKDKELIATRQGILASQHIIEVIEPYIPKFAIKK
jgi:hypothetical protein